MTMNAKYINSSTLDLHQNESYCMKTLLYVQLFDDILTTAGHKIMRLDGHEIHSGVPSAGISSDY